MLIGLPCSPARAFANFRPFRGSVHALGLSVCGLSEFRHGLSTRLVLTKVDAFQTRRLREAYCPARRRHLSPNWPGRNRLRGSHSQLWRASRGISVSGARPCAMPCAHRTLLDLGRMHAIEGRHGSRQQSPRGHGGPDARGHLRSRPGRGRTPCPNARNPSPADAFACFARCRRAGWTTTSTATVNNVVYYFVFRTGGELPICRERAARRHRQATWSGRAETGAATFESGLSPKRLDHRARREQARAFLGDLRIRRGFAAGAAQAALRAVSCMVYVVTREWTPGGDPGWPHARAGEGC